jgi:hypothetical protein
MTPSDAKAIAKEAFLSGMHPVAIYVSFSGSNSLARTM